MRRVRHAGGVSAVGYHIVWCAKYRRPVLVGKVAEALEWEIRRTATGRGVEVAALEVMPEHVYVFADVPVTLAPPTLVARLKGRTSGLLRQQFSLPRPTPGTLE